MAPRVWFITGASSGFGRSMTELALQRGDKVVATLRRPEVLDDLAAQYPAEQLLVLQVDVRREQDIAEAFVRTQAAFGRLDAVYNNAAKTLLAEFEAVPDATARDIFEANFWGAVSVTRHALRFFREINPPGVGGRIFQISSMSGVSAHGTGSFYCASKHALEAISESISHELNPEWNIRVILIEPGAFPTNAVHGITQLPVHPAYDYPTSVPHRARHYISLLKPDTDVDKANNIIYGLLDQTDPPARVILGLDAVGAIKTKATHLLEVAEKSTSYDLEKDS